MSRKKQPEKERFSPLELFRSWSGPLFILGGYGVISSFYVVGVVAIIIGFGLSCWEVLCDPKLLSKPLIVQMALFAVVLAFFGYFFATVVLPDPGFQIWASKLPGDSYDVGKLVDGLPWRREFVEVKTVISNNSSKNYDNVDLFLEGNATMIAGTLRDKLGQCHLNFPDIIDSGGDIGGVWMSGLAFYTGTRGQDLSIIGSYRYELQCQTIAPHTSIGMSFIVSSIETEGPPFTKIVIDPGKIHGTGEIVSYKTPEITKFAVEGRFRFSYKTETVAQFVALRKERYP